MTDLMSLIPENLCMLLPKGCGLLSMHKRPQPTFEDQMALCGTCATAFIGTFYCHLPCNDTARWGVAYYYLAQGSSGKALLERLVTAGKIRMP